MIPGLATQLMQILLFFHYQQQPDLQQNRILLRECTECSTGSYGTIPHQVQLLDTREELSYINGSQFTQNCSRIVFLIEYYTKASKMNLSVPLVRDFHLHRSDILVAEPKNRFEIAPNYHWNTTGDTCQVVIG